MDAMGWAMTLTGAVLGMMAGAALAWRVIGQRAKQRHARLVAAAREQIVTTTQNLRATNARLQAELEKERAVVQQRQSVVSAQLRSEVARLEGQLRFAYVEIDRLNSGSGKHGGASAEVQTDVHGFALTRPYER